MKFSDVIGQQKTKEILIRSVRNNRVSHAQLILGPEGSGKLALALAYAQYIHCENRQDHADDADLIGDSCGRCPSCIKHAKLVHPDLHFFYPVSTTKSVTKNPKSSDFIAIWRNLVLKNKGYPGLLEWYEELGLENKQGIINAEDCDEIVRRLGYKSYESEYKIVLLWMAEKLFHSAAPKILKILEEPPDKTLFLLVVGNHEQMLSTILSRTQLIKIPKLTDTDIMHTLIQVAKRTESQARRIATLCTGNIRMALSLTEEEEGDDRYLILFRNWMRYCYKPDYKSIVKFSDDMAKESREILKGFFSFALRITRQCLLIHAESSRLFRSEAEELEFIDKFHPFINPSNVTAISDEFNNALFHLERNANVRILFTDLSLSLSRLIREK